MRRTSIALLLLVLALAVAAAPARAQVSNPFGGGETATPAPTATPAADQGSLSRDLLFGIAGGVLVVFVGIGFFITRDARRNLTPEDRRAVERGDDYRQARTDEEHKVDARTKARARARAKRQRQARKANRPR